MHPVNPLSGSAPYFIILLCLTPDNFTCQGKSAANGLWMLSVPIFMCLDRDSYLGCIVAALFIDNINFYLCRFGMLGNKRQRERLICTQILIFYDLTFMWNPTKCEKGEYSTFHL